MITSMNHAFVFLNFLFKNKNFDYERWEFFVHLLAIKQCFFLNFYDFVALNMHVSGKRWIIPIYWLH